MLGGEKLSGTTHLKPFLSLPTEEHSHFPAPQPSPEPCLGAYQQKHGRRFSGSISTVGCWWETGSIKPPGLGVELMEMLSASELLKQHGFGSLAEQGAGFAAIKESINS